MQPQKAARWTASPARSVEKRSHRAQRPPRSALTVEVGGSAVRESRENDEWMTRGAGVSDSPQLELWAPRRPCPRVARDVKRNDDPLKRWRVLTQTPRTRFIGPMPKHREGEKVADARQITCGSAARTSSCESMRVRRSNAFTCYAHEKRRDLGQGPVVHSWPQTEPPGPRPRKCLDGGVAGSMTIDRAGRRRRASGSSSPSTPRARAHVSAMLESIKKLGY